MIRKPYLYLALLAFLSAFAGPLAQAAEMPEVMFILDGSGSMWGSAGSQKKIEAAKEVMAKVVPELPEGLKVGLTVYGHRKKGDCSDVEVMIPSGSDDRAGLLAQVKGISPKGKTPIAASVKMVAESLKTKEVETTIVLVSDGIETCNDDPCGVIKALKESGIKFVLHVVGFGVDAKGQEQLTCLAQAGGGKYFAAQDAGSLLAALETVKKEVAVKVEQAKSTEVKAKSKLGKLKITMPASTVKSQAEIKIVRVQDGKVVKNAKPAAEGTHPLLAGEYEVVLQYANTNYKPPSEASLGKFEVKGGEVTEIALGGLVLNRAEGLGDAAVAVAVMKPGSEEPFVRNDANGNDYYLWKPKPLPAGTYDLGLVQGRDEKVYRVFKGIKIEPGKEAVLTIDAGIMLKKNPQIQAWELTEAGSGQVVFKVQRRWDNDWPLWHAFPAEPGTYGLNVYLQGMDDPLPAGEGIEIKQGQTITFDPGL